MDPDGLSKDLLKSSRKQTCSVSQQVCLRLPNPVCGRYFYPCTLYLGGGASHPPDGFEYPFIENQLIHYSAHVCPTHPPTHPPTHSLHTHPPTHSLHTPLHTLYTHPTHSLHTAYTEKGGGPGEP